MELADNGAWHLGWLTCEHGLAFEAECNRQCNPLSHLFSLMPCTTCHSPDILHSSAKPLMGCCLERGRPEWSPGPVNAAYPAWIMQAQHVD